MKMDLHSDCHNLYIAWPNFGRSNFSAIAFETLKQSERAIINGLKSFKATRNTPGKTPQSVVRNI